MKILIVDDMEENLYMLESLLKGSGYEVASALNGIEAQERLKKDSFDMIISDILMPKMDGYQLCREVKKDDKLRKIPFVFYTATYTGKKDEEFGLSLGADRFIVKPMEPVQLLEIIEGLFKDYKNGLLSPSEISVEIEDEVYLEGHRERLINKLEDKLHELEVTNKVLRESEAKYSALVENATDGIVIVQEGKLRFVNATIFELLGYTFEEMIGMDFMKMVSSDNREIIEKRYKDIMAGKDVPHIYEIANLRKDGTTVPMEVNSALIDYEGKQAEFLFIRDITERKKAEEELKKRTYDIGERIKELNCLYSISKLDVEGKTALEKIFQEVVDLISPGWQYPEITCSRIIMEKQEYRTNNFREVEWKQASDIVVHGEKIGTLEVCYLEEKPELDEGPFLKEERNLINTIAEQLGRIIERKQAEEKIKEYSANLEGMVEERTRELNRALYDTEAARDRIDGILKSVSDGLIVTDIYNRITLMNRAAEDLLSVRFSEVIDRPIDFAVEEKTLREKLIDTYNKKKTDYQFDFELPGDDPKSPRFMRARTSVIYDREGKHTGIVTIFHDVTHEREVDRMKTEFLSTAAHELRSPLTSIQGFSEILQTREDLSEEEKIRFLSYINKQAVNLAEIVSDLLDISRIESGQKYTINKEICNTGEAIKNIIPYFQEISSKHKFEVVLPDKSVECYVDKEKMEQALKNILSNAVKYSPEGGVIRVSGEVFEDYYQVSVEDQGIGMTPEHIEKIFDKFYRVDASDTAIEGTGLGMSIVKYIVEAHGGKVWVESEFEKGTTVRFTIPLK